MAACRDEGPEISATSARIREWVAQSGIFEESTAANDPHTRYEMGQIITPANAKEMMGYHQMDLYIPIVYKGRPE